MFSRPLSRFTCHQLNKYSFRRPKSSQLKYQFPFKSTKLTANLSKNLLKNLSGKLSKLGPFTIETGSPAHIGPHSAAIDFIVPNHTPVLAAAAGEVIEVINKYSIPQPLRIIGSYWPTRLFRGQLNYITLKHKTKKIEEFTQYGHLSQNSAQVKIGQKVVKGQFLAQTGWSGWMDRPHLHFVVYTEKVTQFPQETHEGLKPTWQNPS